MPRKVQEHRRRSKRLKEQVPEQGVMEPEGQEEVDSQSKGMLILTPRNPIRGSSRLLRSRATTGLEEQAEPVNLKPLQVVLQKVKADINMKRKKKKKKEEEEEEDEGEEEEDEGEMKEEVENGTQHQDTPRSIMPPLVVKYQESLRPAMSSLQKLRAKIPEEPRRRTIWRDLPKIPTVRKTPMGTLTRRRPSCSLLLCILLPAVLLLALCSWYLLGSGQGALPTAASGLVGLLKVDWIYSSLPWQQEACQDDCKMTLVESIPIGLLYSKDTPHHLSIYQGWMDLLAQANHTVQIAAFYFTLSGSDLSQGDGLASEGDEVFKQLVRLKSRGISLKIAVNSPQQFAKDTDYLEKSGAEVRQVFLKNLTGGIVHTKLWVVDGQHVYIGSANMDWRSLTQVKELGVVLSNCSCLARDVARIFGTYWHLGTEGAAIPQQWPGKYTALSSKERPLRLKLNGIEADVYVTSAPPSLCASGRTPDLDAILSAIDDAEAFVSVSVMELLPSCQYCEPPRFWPAIDDRLRKAACERRVSVRLLISCWQHTYQPMFIYLKSLSVLAEHPLHCDIEVRIFKVPATEQQKKIPYSRVNHNKYMVTDRIAYIGTSNWSEDYFVRTAGVGLIINQTGVSHDNTGTLQSQLKAVFERDWNSNHALKLDSEEMKQQCLWHREGA
ncbi:5'-3' exonuclease PLD3 [Stegostoma tigrinum]|uniref:5'-3' exonuclease PLD3 n=1 Tax=Stegostoma tigrinum TaxID=3053191 RepID=UPI0028706E0C|nr:5'-3' exonuclease PLD3 [Stegostoma tigrinum]